MGLVTDDANAIADLTDALAGLVTQQKLIQAEEKALHQISVKHQIVTRADIDEKQVRIQVLMCCVGRKWERRSVRVRSHSPRKSCMLFTSINAQRANMKKSIERMFKRLATTDTDGDMVRNGTAFGGSRVNDHLLVLSLRGVQKRPHVFFVVFYLTATRLLRKKKIYRNCANNRKRMNF